MILENIEFSYTTQMGACPRPLIRIEKIKAVVKTKEGVSITVEFLDEEIENIKQLVFSKAIEKLQKVNGKYSRF